MPPVEVSVMSPLSARSALAGWIGEEASRGTCYADSYGSVPFQRMPNVSLAPGAKERSLEDLIAATDDGIVVAGHGSWSRGDRSTKSSP
jgi:predicted Zn-dependent protease